MAMNRRGPGRAAWAIGLVAAVLLAAPVVEAGPLASQRTYRVKPGDSLSVIAQRKLQRASRWTRLYALNRQVVGSNPHLIYPGQRLRLQPGGAALASRAPRRGPRVARWQGQGREGLGASRRVAVAPRRPRLTTPLSEEVAFGARSTAPVASTGTRQPAATASDPEGATVQRQAAQGAAIAPGEVVTMPAPRPMAGAPNPWVAAGASLVLPGAGQAYAGDWGRGAIYAGAAAAVYGLAFYGMQTQNEAIARTGGYALLGLSVAAPIDAFLGAKHKEASLAAQTVKMGGK